MAKGVTNATVEEAIEAFAGDRGLAIETQLITDFDVFAADAEDDPDSCKCATRVSLQSEPIRV